MMKTTISIAGRGLEELYRFLEDQGDNGIELDVKYHFNHWFLSAEIAAVKLCGDREEMIALLLEYYEGRKVREVEVMIDNEEKISFKGKEMVEIREELSSVKQEMVGLEIPS